MIPPAPPSIRVRDALARARRRLEHHRVPEAGLKSEWTLAETLGLSRTDLLLRQDAPVPSDFRDRFERRISRLASHQPLQYVLGDTEFFGRRFFCDRRALIPRPETEGLVSAALGLYRTVGARLARIADVGTGTGCIAVTLALECPGARILATDRSAAALALARKNARVWKTRRIRFVQTDLLTGVASGSLDAIVSNPPYVRAADWPKLERQIRRFEPRIAFDGGADGLDLIRRLIQQARRALRPGGTLFLEIGDDQAAAVRTILRVAGFRRIETHRDLEGHMRILRAESVSVLLRGSPVG